MLFNWEDIKREHEKAIKTLDVEKRKGRPKRVLKAQERVAFLALLKDKLMQRDTRLPAQKLKTKRLNVFKAYVRSTRRARRQFVYASLTRADTPYKLLKLVKTLREGRCLDCMKAHTRIEFDHTKGVKNTNISDAYWRLEKDWGDKEAFKMLRHEMGLVDPVCPTCHRVRERIRRLSEIRQPKYVKVLKEVFVAFGLVEEIEQLWEKRKIIYRRRGLDHLAEPRTPVISEELIPKVVRLTRQVQILNKRLGHKQDTIDRLKAEVTRLRNDLNYARKRQRRR